MNINDDRIKEWSLALCDQLSSVFQLNIHFKKMNASEHLYRDFIVDQPNQMLGVMSEYLDTNQSFLVATPLATIVGATTCFFSKDIQGAQTNITSLSYIESFFASQFINNVQTAFDSKNIAVKFLKSETDCTLIHPFHDEDLVKTYQFDWEINDQKYGELFLCHSQNF